MRTSWNHTTVLLCCFYFLIVINGSSLKWLKSIWLKSIISKALWLVLYWGLPMVILHICGIVSLFYKNNSQRSYSCNCRSEAISVCNLKFCFPWVFHACEIESEERRTKWMWLYVNLLKTWFEYSQKGFLCIIYSSIVKYMMFTGW